MTPASLLSMTRLNAKPNTCSTLDWRGNTTETDQISDSLIGKEQSELSLLNLSAMSWY